MWRGDLNLSKSLIFLSTKASQNWHALRQQLKDCVLVRLCRDGGIRMKRVILTAGLLCFLLAATNGFAQSRITGTSADASGALIPGVSVTATNTQTGVVTTVLSNESGAYNFASLQPGSYKVIAELPGFQTQTYTDVQLGGAQQVRLNFTLQVGGLAQNVEVTIAADTVLATSSNSIGTILPEYKVRDLPTIAGNVFNIVQNMPGVMRDNTT